MIEDSPTPVSREMLAEALRQLLPDDKRTYRAVRHMLDRFDAEVEKANEPIPTSDRGNENLSGQDMRLWGIVFSVMMHWQTQVIFRHMRMHVGERKNEYITFFVPKDAPFFYEICKFIEGHLQEMRRDGTTSEIGYLPGTVAEVVAGIYSFKGVNPVLPAEVSMKLMKSSLQRFMQELGSPRRRERLGDKLLEKIEGNPELLRAVVGKLHAPDLEDLLKDEEKTEEEA